MYTNKTPLVRKYMLLPSEIFAKNHRLSQFSETGLIEKETCSTQAELILIIRLQDIGYLPSNSMDWDFCSRCHVRSSFITIELFLRTGWRASSS